MLATGKRGVIAFEGAYHGLGYGALNATHREHFPRSVPFTACASSAISRHSPQVAQASRLPQKGKLRRRDAYATLASVETRIRQIFLREKIGAILVEPVQARGGCNVPPQEFLPLLRKLCDEHGALLILDEIYTGFGRTGKWFACEH